MKRGADKHQQHRAPNTKRVNRGPRCPPAVSRCRGLWQCGWPISARLSKRTGEARRGKAGQMTISDENRARFEGLGIAEVQHELGVGHVRYLSGETRVQAQEWLAEQNASSERERIRAKSRDTRRFIAGIIVGALGALGALGTIIAAWLVIKVWLR
jgi:hypothetical protein